MVRVKGSKISSKLSYLKAKHGADAWGKVLASMSAEDQRALALVLDVSWYPQDLYERVLKAICRTMARGDESIYARIGEYTAEHQFSHLYRAYRTSDLAQTLQNMVPLHAKLNDPSGMEVSLEGPGRATLVVTAPPSTPVICAVSRAFYRSAVERHGVSSVEVHETQCSGRGDEVCRFEIRWTLAAA